MTRAGAGPWRRLGAGVTAATAALTLAGIAWADDVVTPPSASRQSVAVTVSERGIRAQSCGRDDRGEGNACAGDGTLLLSKTKCFTDALGQMTARVEQLSADTHIAVVEGAATNGARYVVMLAGGKWGKGTRPVVLWQGCVSKSTGVVGEERTVELTASTTPNGKRYRITTTRAEATLCGKSVPSEPIEIDPVTLHVVRGKMPETLSASARSNAPTITPSAIGESPAFAGVLSARAAGGSRGYTQLTDGDPATLWSEELPGDGRHEFVDFAAPSDVTLTGLDFFLRNDAGVVPPREMYVVTDSQIVRVDAGATADAGWLRVKFDQPERTRCVGLVLGETSKGDVDVSIGEVRATTTLDGETYDDLVRKLDSSAEVANAASAILARGGTPAVNAALAGYASLDLPGKTRARITIDTAPCSVKVPFYIEQLTATGDPSARGRAQNRLLGCRDEVSEPLAKQVQSGRPDEVVAGAEELAFFDPRRAVREIVGVMHQHEPASRRALRAALSRALTKKPGQHELGRLLDGAAFPELHDIAKLDLLRAAGPRLGQAPGAEKATLDLASDKSFRTRYLVLGPLSELAAGAEGPRGVLRQALLKDESAHVRARAAEVVASGRVRALYGDLLQATRDKGPRVRRAALQSLAEVRAGGNVGPSEAQLLQAAAHALESDPWTFVRRPAIDLLVALGTAKADATIFAAFDDDVPDVRIAVFRALGRRNVRDAVEPLREVMTDGALRGIVRAASVEALAQLCDHESLDDFTRYAARAAFPLDEDDRVMGMTAIAALGRLRPADLEERLRPLTDSRIAASVRAAVAGAIKSPGGACR